MPESHRDGMSETTLRVVFILVLILIAVPIGFWLWGPRDLLSREATSAPSSRSASVPERPAADLQQEAESHVRRMRQPRRDPVSVEHADHFVRSDRPLSLIREDAIEDTTLATLLADPGLQEDAPITIVREVEEVRNTTLEALIADAGGDVTRKVTVLEEDRTRRRTVAEVLDLARADPDRPIRIVEKVRRFESTTPGRLKESGTAGATPLRVIRGVASDAKVTVAELMGQPRGASDNRLFYVRTVREDDQHGIWGIIHHGLTENFARGVAIRRGEAVETYRVDIPEDADERLADLSSSFLGRLIHRKTRQTAVYNFQAGRIGSDPNVISAGQEIVIVGFEPDELIAIYKHFVNQPS